MAVTTRSGYCKLCEQQRKVERPRPNHLLHLILSLLTFGIWIIVWIGVSVQFGGWRCTECGGKKVSKVR